MSERIASLSQKYGPMAAIGLFLVWWMASDVSGSLKALTETLNNHASETAFYMRQVCLNTAQNEAQRAGCIGR